MSEQTPEQNLDAFLTRHNAHGRTWYVCWGQPAGWHFIRSEFECRLLMGRLAFGYDRFDVECFIAALCQKAKER